MLYEVHLAWAGFELTTLVVIGTDCTGSCKSNYQYHTIMTAPVNVCNGINYPMGGKRGYNKRDSWESEKLALQLHLTSSWLLRAAARCLTFSIYKILVYVSSKVFKSLHGSTPVYLQELVSVYQPTRSLRSRELCIN